MKPDFKPPARLRTEVIGDRVRFLLPQRELGSEKHVGWIVVACGGLGVLFMIGWMYGPIASGIQALQQGNDFGWMEISFGCLGLLGLAMTSSMAIAGLAVVCNRTHCGVELRDGKLVVTEWLFFVRFRRKRDATSMKRLRVTSADEGLDTTRDQPALPWIQNLQSALVGEGSEPGKFAIAVGYPRDLMRELATELARRLDSVQLLDAASFPRTTDVTAGTPPAASRVAIVEGMTDESVMVAIPQQPANSAVTIERRPEGVTISMPPAGIKNGSKGLLLFAILWNAFVGFIVVIAALAALGVIKNEGDGPTWLILLILLPFVAVGVGLILACVDAGRRYATIATAQDRILVVHQSIFGRTVREWSADELEDIRCGNSGLEINDVPMKELQIIPLKDKKFGSLRELTEPELTWIAAELKQALGLTSAHREQRIATLVVRDETGAAIPSSGSRITCERTADQLFIHVSPRGLRSHLAALIFGIVCLLIGLGCSVAIINGGLDDAALFFFAIISVICFGCGIAVGIVALVMAHRRFELTVRGDGLTLLRVGLFGQRSFHWQRDDLESIQAIKSGTQVNQQDLLHVYIKSRSRDSLGIMTGHGRDDLLFVSTAVTEQLSLSSPTQPFNETGNGSNE